MSKIIDYVVRVTFQDHVNSDVEIQEVGQNITDAVVSHVNSVGLSPEDSDTFTVEVVVSHQGIIIDSKTFI